MTKEELKQKCTERAKIFQQAMESCHSSSPMDCIEWFADRIAELEAQNEKMKCYLPVDERDSDHKWFAYKNLFDTEWKIDYSVQGELPKCNTIKWFENKEAVMFYLVSNGMKYKEPRR